MKVTYNHKEIEKKWRENWEKNPVNVVAVAAEGVDSVGFG